MATEDDAEMMDVDEPGENNKLVTISYKNTSKMKFFNSSVFFK